MATLVDELIKNPHNIDVLNDFCDCVDWSKISGIPALIDILVDFLTKVDIDALLSNPEAIKILNTKFNCDTFALMGAQRDSKTLKKALDNVNRITMNNFSNSLSYMLKLDARKFRIPFNELKGHHLSCGTIITSDPLISDEKSDIKPKNVPHTLRSFIDSLENNKLDNVVSHESDNDDLPPLSPISDMSDTKPNKSVDENCLPGDDLPPLSE